MLSSTAPPGCRNGEGFALFKKHLISIGIGLVALNLLIRMDYVKLFALSKPLMFVSIFLLLITLFYGGEARGGAYRWIKIGWGFTFQPAELVKLSIVIYTASFLTRKQEILNNFKEVLLPLLIITLVSAGLVLFQPDLGTAVVIVGVSIILWWVGGISTLRILIILVFLVTLGVLFIWIEPYRRMRILAFWDPWSSPHGYGYQIIQSLLAFGIGGIWGTGLGRGLQKFYYLPAPYTDFIFSVVGEELGLVGSFLVLTLYGLIGWTSFQIARKASITFGKLLGMGITFLMLLQAFINLGGVTNFIPCTGMPLPFLSYGGSSMLVNMSCVGILLSISRREDKIER
ncbi:MAG: putative lipid II flippase FtsW [Synergistetes bacterium]|nr:putative lipid II flippase FtsW [Synergistota bacterium]MCX8127784.1 putative lipid II flippase FtsW [Synergistota bacterium]